MSPYRIHKREYGYTRCLTPIGRKNFENAGPEYLNTLLKLIGEVQQAFQNQNKESAEKGGLEKEVEE